MDPEIVFQFFNDFEFRSRMNFGLKFDNTIKLKKDCKYKITKRMVSIKTLH
jgi:hypothetical protein